jgi:hypothetical protein
MNARPASKIPPTKIDKSDRFFTFHLPYWALVALHYNDILGNYNRQCRISEIMYGLRLPQFLRPRVVTPNSIKEESKS